MRRLIRYLKPYSIAVAATIVLLFVQAMSDLALPDYMSRIVNGGIQQGGIADAVPMALRQSTMAKLLSIMSDEHRERVLADYVLVDSASPDFGRYLALYPSLSQEPAYVLKSIDAGERAYLDDALGVALAGVSALEQAVADPASATAKSLSAMLGPSAQAGEVDLFSLLADLPEAQRGRIVAAVDAIVSAMGSSLVGEAAAARVRAEYVAMGVDTSHLQTAYMLRVGVQMLGIALLSGLAAVAAVYLSARVAAGVARDLRRAVFERVESFSLAEFDHFSTASLITRCTNDVTQLQQVIVMVLRMACFAPIMAIGGVIRAVDKSASMWWLVALAALTLMGVIAVLFSLALPRFRRIQSLIDRLNLVSRESLSGMMVIRAFNRQDFELQRFDKANRDVTGTLLFVNRLMAFMQPAMMLIMNGLSLAIVWVGAHQVAQASLQVGDLMAFIQYAMQIVMSFLMLSLMFIIVPRAAVSAERIAEVLATEPSVRDPERPATFASPFVGTVEFADVSFRYPGAEEDVLSGITFTAEPGKTTAIIGATGSGKTTLVNLIPRFYDVTGGAIYVGGVDVRAVAQHDLREHIGYVPQKSTLFSGTIESNLRYADEDAGEESLRQAADIAQADEIIAARPEGMASEISQGGGNVSGGQRQRLSIARALVKQPPIYIFDDSFSALDFRTERALRGALKESTAEATVFIVTQRISTIRNAEQIIVLDEGRMVARGTHDELMLTCDAYREIAMSQLSKEELA